MRRLAAFLIALALLVLSVVAIDVGLERVAERQASQQASILIDAPATVDLRGWPVGLRLLFGTIPAADVRASGVPTDSGIRVDRMDVKLSGVRFRLADLYAGRLAASAQSGTFVADLDSAAVEELLGPFGRVSDVRLVDGAVRLKMLGTAIDAPIAVQGETLVLAFDEVPRGVPARLVVPLPTLAPGATIERATVLEGTLRLEGGFSLDALAARR